MFGIGSGWNRWATLAHGAIGVAMVALSPWKSAVSRRGLRHRSAASVAPSLVLTALVVVALASGFAHRLGARELGPLLVMQVHVGVALLAIPLAAWHVVARPVRPRRVDLDRRTALRGGLLAGGATAVTVALPLAGRGTTRSLERGSFRPALMPITQWLDDDVPAVDGDRWRLVVEGRSWSLAQLESLGTEEVVATLDCTGGWYAEQRWSGVPLDRLLAEVAGSDGRSVEVRSLTGYARRFPARDASSLLLATKVGDQPLSFGHGFPLRLVAPSRRGFWWVKWVTEVSVDDRSWWWQPPFPLT